MFNLIDPTHPTVQALVQRGYKLSVPRLPESRRKLRVSYAAKHPESGKYIQGWNKGGTAADALRDLAKNAAKVEDAIPVVPG